jgi:putative hydrolase of HD superfamily
VPEAVSEAAKMIGLLAELARLKAVPRMGWLLRGARDNKIMFFVESVAAHSFGVAVTAMLLADRARGRGMAVDVERLLRLALLHDLTEARTGDLPQTIKSYFDPAALKAADEQAAAAMLEPLGELGREYLELWREYEQRASLEARLVKAADKLDLLLQAREYEKGGARALPEFWENAETDFSGLGVEELIADLVETLRRMKDGG